MPLKEKTARQRDPLRFAAYLCRIPLPVREALQVSDGYCYPICPRSDRSLIGNYMTIPMLSVHHAIKHSSDLRRILDSKVFAVTK